MSALALFERADDDEGEARVAALDAGQVVAVLHNVTELARTLRVADRMLRSRIVADGLLSAGETWTAPDGSEFMWGGDRERVCGDPAALRDALHRLGLTGLAERALWAAFKEQPLKVYFTDLDRVAKFGGEEAERTIRSFVTWKEGAAKLREIGEEGR